LKQLKKQHVNQIKKNSLKISTICQKAAIFTRCNRVAPGLGTKKSPSSYSSSSSSSSSERFRIFSRFDFVRTLTNF
jgi:hypothetical protein